MSQQFTYPEYQAFFEKLVAAGKTSGPDQSEMMVNYTKLNWSRAKRIDKTFKSLPITDYFLNALERKLVFKIITEPWCGDAAQVVPIIAGMAKASDMVETVIVLRDENEELINRYLTNGGKSIPITVITDAETGEELGHWGPRPKAAQELVINYKSTPENERASYDDFVQIVQKWYNNDKTESTQREFLQSLAEAVKQTLVEI